jgi:hypothetical protein
MKKLFILAMVFVALESFKMYSGIQDVVVSLKSGSVSKLISHIDQSLQITMIDNADVYSQNQAEAVLRDFFKLHPVKDFQLLHQGNNAGSNFCIGILKTEKGNYRTTIFMRLRENRELLEEIKFEMK